MERDVSSATARLNRAVARLWMVNGGTMVRDMVGPLACAVIVLERMAQRTRSLEEQDAGLERPADLFEAAIEGMRRALDEVIVAGDRIEEASRRLAPPPRVTDEMIDELLRAGAEADDGSFGFF